MSSAVMAAASRQNDFMMEITVSSCKAPTKVGLMFSPRGVSKEQAPRERRLGRGQWAAESN